MIDGMGEFRFPPRGGAAERGSLFLQSQVLKVGAKVPDESEIERVLERIVKSYPKTTVPKYFQKSTHSVTKADIYRVCDDITKTSSPGLPYAEEFKEKGQLIEQSKDALCEAVFARLNVLQNSVGLPTDPKELVSGDFVDPVRIFVKNEPTKIQKIEEGRVRLIASVSIVDEIIERLLCSAQNEAEISSWQSIPSKPGMGVSLADQALAIRDSIPSDNAAEADVSGWDWSIPYWCFELEVRARIALARASPNSLFAKLLQRRIWCLTRSVFATSDGVLYEQLTPGVMKSGSYLTSSSNSRMRVALAMLVGAGWAIAMGDDSVEEFVPDAKEKYQQMGFKVKMYVKCTRSDFNFCSHHFVNGVAKYANIGKASYKLYSHAPSPELVMDYLQNIRYVDQPVFEHLFNVLVRVWKELGNKFYLDALKQIKAKVQEEERSRRLYEEQKSHSSTSA